MSKPFLSRGVSPRGCVFSHKDRASLIRPTRGLDGAPQYVALSPQVVLDLGTLLD